MSPDPIFEKNVERIAVGFQRIVQLALGLAVVAAGVLFTLDNLHVLRARDYLVYWPVVFIFMGTAQIVQGRAQGRFLAGGNNPAYAIGGLWILIGSAMLARRLGLTEVNVWAFWPLVLIVVGGRIAWQGFHARHWNESIPDNVSILSGTAIMGGFGRRIVSQTFQGGELTAFMGGGKLDLREAALAEGRAVLNVFILMGGFEILVPPTWQVIVEVTPFMGGFEDKTRRSPAAGGPRLIVRGFIMMGGMEIKD